MTLNAAIEAELPFLRREAEALMHDTFELGSYGDGWHYDEDAGIDVRDFTALFTTRGKIMSTTAPSESEVAGRTSVQIERVLHIPVATSVVPVGTVARRVSDGAEFRVLAETTHPQPKSRRFPVEEVLS